MTVEEAKRIMAAFRRSVIGHLYRRRNMLLEAEGKPVPPILRVRLDGYDDTRSGSNYDQ